MTGQHRVADLIFRDFAAVEPESISVGAETPELSRLRGHFALHREGPDGSHLLVRDAVGVNKLFFAIGPNGSVQSSNFFVDLIRAGHHPRDVWSVPSGHAIRITPELETLSLEKCAHLHFADDEPADDAELPAHAARIRQGLDRTFQLLSAVLRRRSVYVTLSGGLDSTTIAALARQHLEHVRGVTFAVTNATETDEPGSDLYYARRVAEALQIPLQIVEVPGTALDELLDDVLVYGQDFRDFNVHCGLVNAAIGRFIGQTDPGTGQRPVVLTGDTMNELVADYAPVNYSSTEFYSLPNLPAHKLRRFLVRGLDTGDREAGVFARFGVETIQPYAIYPELYTRLPGGFLNVPSAKQRLARLMMGDQVPSFIYERPKVRAQVGNSARVGGTLAALVDSGIDSVTLQRRFCQLLGLDPTDLKTWIRAGMYRFPTAYPKPSEIHDGRS